MVARISTADINKASLQQKAVSTGILLDKSLLLSGEATENLTVKVLLEVAGAIKTSRAQVRLPPVIEQSH